MAWVGGTNGNGEEALLVGVGKWLNSLSRSNKKRVLVSVDLFLFFFCLLLAYWLRLGDFSGWSRVSPWLLALASVGGIFSLWLAGFYRNLIRAFDFRSANTLFIGCLIVSTLIAIPALFFDGLFLPRSVPFLFFLLSFIFIGSSRVLARWLYVYAVAQKGEKKPVLILGAGDEGNQIAGILSGSSEFSLVGFLEEDVSLVGSYMRGRRVYALEEIDDVRMRYSNLKVFVSFQNLTPHRKATLYQKLAHPGVEIEIVPPLSDLVAGRSSLESARELRIEDFLGREADPTDPQDFFRCDQR